MDSLRGSVKQPLLPAGWFQNALNRSVPIALPLTAFARADRERLTNLRAARRVRSSSWKAILSAVEFFLVNSGTPTGILMMDLDDFRLQFLWVERWRSFTTEQLSPDSIRDISERTDAEKHLAQMEGRRPLAEDALSRAKRDIGCCSMESRTTPSS